MGKRMPKPSKAGFLRDTHPMFHRHEVNAEPFSEEDVVPELPPSALRAGTVFPTLTSNVPISTDPATNRLVDGFGRDVYFHGANVVVKGFPWMPETDHWTPATSFSDADMKMMHALGLNAIRLGTMWPGAEPEAPNASTGVHSYNHTYLQALKRLVRKSAVQYGVYSLMDMHQDVLSERFCGEGAPLWTPLTNTTNFPYPASNVPYNVSADGVPSYEECHSKHWPSYYFTTATGRAFQNLYTNVNELRDSWAGFWSVVSETMSDLGSAVLGYELINEPWAGDAVQDPLIMIPGVADRLFLQPAYDVLSTAIRGKDTEHAIFFEPVTWDDFGSGFTTVPGGASWQNKSVLSYHFYVPPDFSIPIQFAERQKDQQRLGSGGMLTEFAIMPCNGCGTVTPTAVMDACDHFSQSWLFWAWKPFQGNRTGWSYSVWYPNGTINNDIASMVARTYPQYVAGRTESMSFQLLNSTFFLIYEVVARVNGAPVAAGGSGNITQIYFSEDYHYPQGIHVDVMGSGQGNSSGVWSQIVGRNTLHVWHDGSVPVGTFVTIKVTKP